MSNKIIRLLQHMGKRERIGQKAMEYGLGEVEAFKFSQVRRLTAIASRHPSNFWRRVV